MTRRDGIAPHVRALLPLGLLAATVPSACTDRPENVPAGTPTFTVRDSAGIEIVESTDSLWTSATAWHLGPTPVVEIGDASGEDPFASFGAVSRTMRLNDGTIAVLDPIAVEIRVFGVDGTYLRSIGRRGPGPGEFALPDHMAQIRGDSIVVRDAASYQLQVLTLEGEYGRTYSGPPIIGWEGLSSVLPVDWLPDGGFLVTHTLQDDELPERRQTASAEWHHFDASGTHVGLVAVLPATHGERMPPAGGYLVDGETRFSPTQSYAIDQTGLWHAFPTSFELRHITLDGRVDRILRRASTPEAVSESAKESFRAWFEERNDPTDPTMSPAGRARRRAEIAALAFADTFPAFRTFHLGTDGSVWVQPYPSADSLTFDRWDRYGPPGPSAWPVFDPRGRWLGSVEIPDGFRIHQIGEDFVLGVWRDEYDVQFVRMYRIVKGR